MQIELSLFSIILLIGAAHGLFLALALINTRDAKGAGRGFLALLTLAFAIDLGHEFLFQSRHLLTVLELAYVDPLINLIYGPSIYWYTRTLTENGDAQVARHYWLHWLPLAVGIMSILLLPELTADEFIHLFYQDAAANSDKEILVQTTVGRIALASVFSIGIYLYFSIRRLVKHAICVKEQFSSIEQVTLNWLKLLLLLLSLLYFILIFDGFFSSLLGLNDNVNNLLYILLVSVIYAMGYMGMKQPVIFSARKFEQPLESANKISATESNIEKVMLVEQKYKNSALDKNMSVALKDELQAYMRAKKPYLNSQLTLPELAQQLSISPNYLSQVINEQLHVNFFDLINQYRVTEAKSILVAVDKKHLAVVDIAFEAGFNSKSAFYTAFRKHVGLTPSQYRKSTMH